MTEERYEFTVAPEEEGRRLDAYLAQKLQIGRAHV